jgi:K+/H+ antiporter YhaU regulatory subunit KhtT
LVTANAQVVGQKLEVLRIPQTTGATVLAVLREGTPILSRGDLSLGAGDHVLALGTGEQLEKLEDLIAMTASP